MKGSLFPAARIQAFFGAIASRYDLTNRVLSLGCDRWWRRWVAREVARALPQRVLDLATGSGDLALELARTMPYALILGADFCAPMLQEARKKGARHLLVADGLQLPFAAETFDAITIAFGLRNMESWETALRECARVLAPAGRLLVLDFSLPKPPLRALYRIYLHALLPRIAGLVTGERDIYQYLADSIEEFPSGEKMQVLMEAAGLSRMVATPLQGGIVTAHTAVKA